MLFRSNATVSRETGSPFSRSHAVRKKTPAEATMAEKKAVSLIWADECHRLTKKTGSWWNVVDYFMSGNPECKLVGTTATPDRRDEVSLGQVFDTVSFDYPLFSTEDEPSAIRDGWLVPIKQEFVTLGEIQFEAIKSRGGDFIDSALEKALLEDKIGRAHV